MINKIKNKLLLELSYQNGKKILKPEFLSLIVTFKCNFRCPSCFIWERPSEPEMDIKDWQKIADQIQETLPKTSFIEINGGEALIKKDLTIGLIKSLKSRGFSKVALNSNGSTINNQTVDELIKSGLDIIKISLYSLNKEIHDRMRGFSGAYEVARGAVEMASKNGLKTEVAILLTAENVKSLPELIGWINQLNNISAIIQPLDEKIESPESENQDGNYLPQESWPQPEDVKNFFDWLKGNSQKIKNSQRTLELIKKYYLNPKKITRFRCFAGQRNLVIYPNGNVTFCFKRGPIGNVRQEALKDILKRATAERKNIKKCPKYCRILGCNFSRGLKEFFLDI